MSLQVLNAHTGARYNAGVESLTSLNTLRAWIAKASTVAAQNQILLTAQGRQAKSQTLRLEVRSNPTSSCMVLTISSEPDLPLRPAVATTVFSQRFEA